MLYAKSLVNEHWWDFTCLDEELLARAAKLTEKDVLQLANKRLNINIYDNLDDMFLSQAMEYITTWQQASVDSPAGICGPVGPTRQMPLVAKIVNELSLDLRHCHFWGMDEWCVDGETINPNNGLSFTGTNHRLWIDKIRPELRMPVEQLHFPTLDNLKEFSDSFSTFDCKIMQGGLGHTLHWAFNEPLIRDSETPMSAEAYRQLKARYVDLHPISTIQNAAGIAGRYLNGMPTTAVTVGPAETFQCDQVSIWYPGNNQNPFGLKLALLMLSEGIQSSLAPISVLAEHPNVTFHIYRPSLITCELVIM
ncbi:hypothetical protein [Thaumasiovibrio sp. DFM-14]|uniref:hypothetical protein n=1 Tax=Thaumasiovibrio sp. DFM-14 TaxID=3384792 RepID=UPI0039A041AC